MGTCTNVTDKKSCTEKCCLYKEINKNIVYIYN